MFVSAQSCGHKLAEDSFDEKCSNRFMASRPIADSHMPVLVVATFGHHRCVFITIAPCHFATRSQAFTIAFPNWGGTIKKNVLWRAPQNRRSLVLTQRAGCSENQDEERGKRHDTTSRERLTAELSGTRDDCGHSRNAHSSV
jgi:hypothetical protein